MTRDEVLQLAEDAAYCSNEELYDQRLMMYNRTNENLTDLFKQFSVRDKDVFTVLASSDQLFSCYYHKAKSIDTFDKVYPTIFYYYLRKWVILYQKFFYPSYYFFEKKDMFLYFLICDIKPTNQDEADSQIFWKHYLEKTNYRTNKYLFYIASCNWPVPFENDINSLNGLFDKPLSFKCIDFFKEIDSDKDYDVLVLSNVLEGAVDEKDLEQARKNMEALLRDDGIAICTYLRNKKGSFANKKEIRYITSNSLEFEDVPHRYYEPLIAKTIDFAYSYKKVKKIN